VPAVLDALRAGDPDLRARCAAILKHLAPDDGRVAEAIREAEADDSARTAVHEIPMAIAVA
jgi:hypothetical protein